MYYLSVRHNANPAFVSNCLFAVANTTSGETVLNMSGIFKVETKNNFYVLKLNGKKDQKSSNYDQLLLSGTIESCKIRGQSLGSFIMKALMPNILDYATFFNCPQSKGEFYLKEFPVIDASVLPTYLLPYSGKWELTVIGKTKVLKSTTTFLTFQVYGLTVK